VAFISFLGVAFQKTPVWWRVMGGFIVVGSLLITLNGRTPDWIAHKWCAWFFLITFLFYVSTLWGAFVITKELKKYLLKEYRNGVERVRSGQNLFFSSQEQAYQYYAKHIEADAEILRLAVKAVHPEVED
jgi:hypothetical protein